MRFHHNLLPNPKSTCLMLLKAQLQDVRVWSKLRFTRGEGGRPSGASAASCSLDQAKGFKGLGNRLLEALVGPVLFAGTWNWPCMVRRSGVLVLVRTWSFGSGDVAGDISVPGAAGSQRSLPCMCFSCMTSNFSLLSLKNNSVCR